jgi:hypothetical protein
MQGKSSAQARKMNNFAKSLQDFSSSVRSHGFAGDKEAKQLRPIKLLSKAK